MGNDNPSNPILDKQENTRKLPATGFHTNPERINREGRPKRKTLTELIHAKLDNTPGAWDAIVNTVIQKVIKDKEKEIIKTFWQYTDGMPKQTIAGDDDHPINVNINIKDLLDKAYGKSGSGNTK